jgi:hypothetical protein
VISKLIAAGRRLGEPLLEIKLRRRVSLHFASPGRGLPKKSHRALPARIALKAFLLESKNDPDNSKMLLVDHRQHRHGNRSRGCSGARMLPSIQPALSSGNLGKHFDSSEELVG